MGKRKGGTERARGRIKAKTFSRAGSTCRLWPTVLTVNQKRSSLSSSLVPAASPTVSRVPRRFLSLSNPSMKLEKKKGPSKRRTTRSDRSRRNGGETGADSTEIPTTAKQPSDPSSSLLRPRRRCPADAPRPGDVPSSARSARGFMPADYETRPSLRPPRACERLSLYDFGPDPEMSRDSYSAAFLMRFEIYVYSFSG